VSNMYENTKYRVIRKISEGVSAHVYLVEKDGKQYALKSLKTSDQSAVIRFRSETSTLARLNHPSLVKIFDVGEENNFPYLVMEYLEGDSLAGKLKASGTMPESECLPIIVSLAGALGELHKNNLVHRDIKPANIVLSTAGVKLIDLGLVGDVEQIKRETPLVGTPLYCSPEQTKILRRDVSFYSDLYSLGIVFYEMLTGTPPFTGSLNEILQQHSSTPVPNLRKLKPDLKESVVVIIEKLLAKDPDDRYQSSIGLLSDLQRLIEIDDFLQQKQDPKLGRNDKRSIAVRVQYVERTVETKKLHHFWGEAKKGTSGLHIVKGGSGSGKTRLCSEFVEHLINEEKNQLLILRGKSQIYDREMPFGAIRGAIDSLLEATSTDSPEVKAETYRKLTLAAEGKEDQLVRLSKNLQRVLKKSAIKNTEVDIEGEREKFFESIAEFFVKLSEQWAGLILVVDDLQWLDGSSIQIIQSLTNHLCKKPIFILGTARNDKESEPFLKSLEETLGPVVKSQLEIGGFTKDQMSSLLSSYLGANDIDPSIVEMFFTKSGGNPFIATEYLRAVVEEGALIFKNHKWQLTDTGLEKLTFSRDVYDLIMKRIEGSSSELKNLLKYAAVYGNIFSSSDIAKVAGVESSLSEQIFVEGERLGLLDRVSPQKLKFSHDKIPESLRQVLTPELHRQICDDLSGLYRKKENKSDEEIFILARLVASGNFEKDIDFTISANTEAGVLSMANHAQVQGYTFLKCAFELAKKTNLERSKLFELVSNLTICAAVVSDWPLAEECVRKAEELSMTREELGSTLVLKVWLKRIRADFTVAWETFRKACDILGHPYPSYFHWKLINLIGMVFLCFFLELTNIRKFLSFSSNKNSKTLGKLADLYFDAVHFAQFHSIYDFLLISFRILALGHLSGRTRELCYGYASIGYVFSNFSVRSLAIPFLNKAVQLSEDLGDPVVKAFCISKRIDGFIFCGITFDETTEFMKYKDFTKRYLPPLEYGKTRSNRALMLYFKGRNQESIDFINSYMNIQNPESARIGSYPMMYSLNQYWINLALLGRASESQAVKAMAAKRCSNYRFIPGVSKYLCTFELESRRFAEEVDEISFDLQEYLEGGVTSLETMNRFTGSVTAFMDLLELENAKNREEEFSRRRRFKANLQSVFFRLYNPLFRINYYLLKAKYSRISNKPSSAKKWLNICEKAASQTGHLRVMFEVQREWARLYKKTDDTMRVKIHLTAALQMASENLWLPAQESLIGEFSDVAEQLLTTMNIGVGEGQAGLTQQQTRMTGPLKSSTHMGSHSSASLTRQASSTQMGSVSNSSGSGENDLAVSGKGELEELRFVEALLKVNQAFVSSLDFVEQSKSVLTQIVKLFAAERGFVFIKNEDSNDYHPLSAKNAQGIDLPTMTGFSSTIIKKVFETSETVITASTDEAEVMGSESAVLYNLRSIMATPLKVDNRLLGVVYLDSTLTKGLFTKRDSGLFSTLANNISVAFDLSRMAKIELEKAALQKEFEIQAAIATESKKVQILVENMKQALFSISSDGTIVEPVSRYSETVFGKKIAGQNLFSVLYNDFQGKKEEADMVRSAIKTVFGEDDLQWDLCESNIPRRVKLNNLVSTGTDNKGTEQILKAQPAPIWDKDNKLERILFVVEDITSLEALERQASQASLRASMLEDILENNSNDLQEFFKAETSTMSAVRSINEKLDVSKFNTILRDLHTLKGNARLYKLKRLSDQIHQSETVLAQYKDKTTEFQAPSLSISEELPKIEEVTNQYRELFEKISKSNSASVTGDTVSKVALEQLEKLVDAMAKHLPPIELAKIRNAVDRLSYKSLRESITRFDRMVNDVSIQLGKKVQFQIQGDALTDVEKLTSLQDCLLHLIRNSLDHGLEEPAERLRKGKPESGTIRVECTDGPNGVSISISDDGRGIDGEIIANKAVQKGLITQAVAKGMSPEEKINLIFMPNFSTSDNVTDISGRGVGMDVVKENVEKVGGVLKIETKVGKGSSFNITLGNTSELKLESVRKAR